MSERCAWLLFRSGSGSTQQEASKALRGTAGRHARRIPSNSPISAQLALQGSASDSEELVDEVALITGPNLAPHDHLPAMDSQRNHSDLDEAEPDQPAPQSGMTQEPNRAAAVETLSEALENAHMVADDRGHNDWQVDAAMGDPGHSVLDVEMNDVHGQHVDNPDALSVDCADVGALPDIDLQDALGIDMETK